VAQKIQTVFVDDLDGSEAEGTVRFGLDGSEYEIDLSQAHKDELAAAVGPYIAVARKVTAARRPGRTARPARHDQSEVRAWAREQGLKVSDRGRIPADVLAKYEAGH